MVEYLMLIGAAGTLFFKNYEYVGFITYQIQIPNKYICNFDFYYNYFLELMFNI
ncbi:MAG: hypothetical protein L6U99_08345 [Clostridium sp.]|nr:MAG: hypothetical protein L6U99_08345 [Clostridium sp.]